MNLENKIHIEGFSFSRRIWNSLTGKIAPYVLALSLAAPAFGCGGDKTNLLPDGDTIYEKSDGGGRRIDGGKGKGGLDAAIPADVPYPDVGRDAGRDIGISDAAVLDVRIPDAGLPDVPIPDIGIPDVAAPDAEVPIEVVEGIYVTPDTGELASEIIDDQEVFYARDKILIEVSPSTTREEVQALAGEFSGEITGYIEPINWYEIAVSDARLALPEFQRHPLVTNAELNYASIMDTLDIELGAMPGYAWGHHQISLPQAYQLLDGRDLEDVIVAVLDGGFDLEHPELDSRFLAGHDFGSADIDPSEETSAGEHGTMVAGVIAMENNGISLNGVAYNARILPIKIFPSRRRDEDETYYSKTFRAAAGIVYAAMQGVDVINMSFGTYVPRPPSVLASAVRYANLRDVVLAASAGNDAIPATIHYPSAFPEVMSVGATAPEDQRWEGSNYSYRDNPNDLLLAAPGENIWSSVPSDDEPRLDHASGTSLAAPFVSGLAALVKSIRPGLTASGIKEILLNSADEISVTDPAGNFHTWRRINAYRAVALALGEEPAAEICDGRDNDLDGTADNNLTPPSQECRRGAGECERTGLEYQVCEGAGGWSSDYRNCNAIAGTPETELCDELDQDCDGNNYNGFNVGELCSVGTGECFGAGAYECTADGSGTRCNAISGELSEEVCDGVDNDCNDIIDNNLTSPSQECRRGAGECERSGLEYKVCEGAGGWSLDYRNCDAVAGEPSEEICDGVDNNCDGMVDNGSLLTFYHDNDGDGFGNLDEFVEACIALEGYVNNPDDCDDTNDAIYPRAFELIDGIDNNCDGAIDEGVSPQIIQISVGGWHTCALLADNTVRCWGANGSSQLGDGTTTNRPSPTPVPGLTDVIQIELGYDYTCGVLTDSTVQCWGDNEYGQLGDGTTVSRNTPTPVPGLTDVIQIELGGAHTCAVLEDRTVRCWGANGVGQLGDGTTTSRRSSTPVPRLTGVVEIGLGYIHTCAVLDDTTLRCWGSNGHGRLGDGTTTRRLSPTPVLGLSGVAQIGLGDDHACALMADPSAPLGAGGAVQCWGYNEFGQLGDGTTTDRYTPTPVPGLTDVAQIGLGRWHTCAVLADTTVRCWGDNGAGRLGDGTTTRRLSPTPVPGLANVTQTELGYYHTCALLSDGTVQCWGWNLWGQLGDGTTIDRYSPTTVVW